MPGVQRGPNAKPYHRTDSVFQSDCHLLAMDTAEPAVTGGYTRRYNRRFRLRCWISCIKFYEVKCSALFWVRLLGFEFCQPSTHSFSSYFSIISRQLCALLMRLRRVSFSLPSSNPLFSCFFSFFFAFFKALAVVGKSCSKFDFRTDLRPILNVFKCRIIYEGY